MLKSRWWVISQSGLSLSSSLSPEGLFHTSLHTACEGPSRGWLSLNPCRPSTPTSLAAEKGPRRDQTVRQPHSRRMRHAWEITCLAHWPTCSHWSFADPQADLGFESSFSLCANSHSLSLQVLTYLRGTTGPAAAGLLGGLVRTSSRCLAEGLASGLFSGVDYAGTQLPSCTHAGHISPC